ncbi:hypothetical protein [Xanthomonas tesorieronis]|uniref:hypothetical protein n=1 Tax=Xanthomonas tesorieronis TaxID=3160839 RepID=UPI0035198551
MTALRDGDARLPSFRVSSSATALHLLPGFAAIDDPLDDAHCIAAPRMPGRKWQRWSRGACGGPCSGRALVIANLR